MATFGSVSTLAVVLALMSILVGPATSQSCEPGDCESFANCQNSNNALMKLVANDSVSLNATVYSYLKTNVTTSKGVIDSLNGYWSTFSILDAKLTAYKKTAEYKLYATSTAQRDKATSYQNKTASVLADINASVPFIPTLTATNATTKSMTDLYGETSYVCGQYKAFLLSWKKYCGCPDKRKRRNSKIAKKSNRPGKKDKKFTTKKANKVIEARKGKGKKNSKGKGKGKKNKNQQ